MKGRFLHKISSQEGLVFKNLSFYLYNIDKNRFVKIKSLPVSFLKRFFSRFRLINRLFRMEPRCVGQLSDTQFVINIFGKIWLIDIVSTDLFFICDLKSNATVLNFCEYKGDLYFGDYIGSSEYYDINIYRLSKDLQLSIIYTFTAGIIRHIHNIVSDLENDCFWILTGDNEKTAGIYKASLDWSSVEPFAIGEQKYRAVVAFPFMGGMIYATDSVESVNTIYWISKEGEISALAEINGSCIYGTQAKDVFLFSTTVEPHEGGGIWNLFSNTLGYGIKSKDVYIVAVNKHDISVKVIAKFQKDIWPMKLFQYGRAPFASGQEESIEVWCYPIACKKFDGKSVLIKVSKLFVDVN